ncbi:gag/pol protein [Cucumis melo var. makuwa]|uniref:Gag/pol protein n=1 Tax=Cucumis melo var. makuwa TaxID=1194695 RepID=A0A5D3E173_CUCMM|nr:gag/pol protein [Cucumis melo var. makuwa]
MNSSIVQLLASEKLNGDNYVAWKSNLNTILVVDDLRFILTEECSQTPTLNANRASRKAYDRWIKANEKARVYILASMSDVLAKKYESLATAKEIMDSLKGIFGQPEWSLRHEAIKYIYTKRMKEGTSVREHVLDMMMHFNIAEINGGTIDEANQEISSWKRLSEGEITLKVGTGEMVSATAVGDLKLEEDTNISSALLMIILGKKIKILRSDLDGRYMDLRFQDYLIEHGIQSQLSTPSTPQQNAQIIIPDDGIEDPLTYKQEINDVDCDQWIKAMDLEVESIYSISVWTLVDQPSEVRPIGCKWIHKRKRDQAGKVQTFKARLVAKGYTQKEMDVKTTFLNGNLEESIYMVKPEGFIQKGKEQKVCKLQKSIYGLKQASRSWNIGFDTAIKSYDFKRNVDEPCVYKRIINSIIAFLVLYVDEILLIGNDVGHLTEIKEWLATQFQLKDLGMRNIYKMKNSKKSLLPYRYGIHLSKEQCPKTPQEVEDMSNIPYAFAVGSLMYAMLCTRPDICYLVEIVSRYQSNPGRDHWTAVKNILKYLRRTKDYMLVYGSKDLILTGYTDSDFQTDKDARKSTSGSVFTLNGGAVVWRSIKQSCIADSTMEAEYVAACEAAKEAV